MLRVKLCILLLICIYSSGQTQGSPFDSRNFEWEMMKSTLEDEKQDSCSIVYDNVIYILGGFNQDEEYFNTLYLFDPVQDTIEKLNDKINGNIPLTLGCTMDRIGDLIFIVGGADVNQNAVNHTFWFNPATLDFYPGATLPRPSAWHSSILIDSKLYIFFGWSSIQYSNIQPCYATSTQCYDSNHIQIYDTINNVWMNPILKPENATASSWPAQREGAPSVLVTIPSISSSPVVVIYGGACFGCLVTNVDRYYRDLWIFFPQNSSFTTFSPVTGQIFRAFHGWVYFMNTFWTTGGSYLDVSGVSTFYNDVKTLDNQFTTWEDDSSKMIGESYSARWSFPPSIVIENGGVSDGIYIIGGASSSVSFNTIYRIKPVLKTDDESSGNNNTVIIAAVVASVGGLLLIGGAVGLFIYFRRRSYKFNQKELTTENSIELYKPPSAHSVLYTVPFTLPSHLEVKTAEELELLINKQSLDFGVPEDTQLEIGMTYEDTFTVSSIGKKTATTPRFFDIQLYYPRNNHKFQLVCKPDLEKLKPGKTITFSIQLVVYCTCSFNIYIAVAVPGGCTKIFIKKQSVLSPFLDYEDVHFEGAPIGEGAYSKVYVGQWKGTQVAVKFLKNQQLTTDEIIDFERETNMLNKLRHPNILNFIGAVHSQGHMCFVTEYMKLGSLSEVMKKHELDIKQKVKFCLDIARAMKFLHQSGILHRDLKPANFLVVSLSSKAEVNVKLADFGTSRAISLHTEKQYTKAIGTPIYMAPEVLGNSEYNTAADVYSFGIILLEIMTGVQPYQEIVFSWDIAAQVLAGNRPSVPNTLPHMMSLLIMKSWNQNPKERPNFEEITTSLENIYHTILVESRAASKDLRKSEDSDILEMNLPDW